MEYGIVARCWIGGPKEQTKYAPCDTIEEARAKLAYIETNVIKDALRKADISKEDLTGGVLLAFYVKDGKGDIQLFEREYYKRKSEYKCKYDAQKGE